MVNKSTALCFWHFSTKFARLVWSPFAHCSCSVISCALYFACFRRHSYTENAIPIVSTVELILFIAIAQHVMHATDHCSLCLPSRSCPHHRSCKAIQFHAICSHQHRIIDLFIVIRRVFCFPFAVRVRIMPCETVLWTALCSQLRNVLHHCCERQSTASC